MKRASKKEILHVRRNTAMVFQLYNLFSNMTVLQNVMEGLVTVQKMAKKEAREKAIACLQQVGMAEYLMPIPSSFQAVSSSALALPGPLP